MEINYNNLLSWYSKNKLRHIKNIEKDKEYIEILKLTSFLDSSLIYPKIKLQQRIWHIKNNLFDIKRCKMCGNPVFFTTIYKSYCCEECNLNYRLSENFKNDIKQTSLEKYGVEHYSNTDEYKLSYTNTCIKKYGVKHSSQSLDFKEKIRQTSLEKYGVEHYSNTDEWKEKIRQTSLEKYGVEYYQLSEEFKEKIKETCLNKYGVDNFFKTEEFKEKSKQKSLEKYGVEHTSQSLNFKTQINKNFKKEFQYKLCTEHNDYRLVDFCPPLYIILCPKCNKEFEITDKLYYNRTKLSHEICTNCNPINKSYSQSEKELVDFIKSIYSGEIIENDRNVIKPKELDIYLPELKLAIEFNGLIWHSDLYKSDDYHLQKTKLCENQDIKLIHIYEDEWNIIKEKIKCFLLNIITPSSNTKIFARKCEIKEVNLKDTNEFLEENHLIGRIFSQSVCYGLYYNSELISLMSFRKIKHKLELQRYAIKLNYIIIGGAEKLFSKVKFNYNIITYCDIDKFSGKIYERLGFKFVRRNKPNFMYIDEKSNFRVSKQSTRKYRTDYIRRNENILRIYNCGIDVYEFYAL